MSKKAKRIFFLQKTTMKQKKTEQKQQRSRKKISQKHNDSKPLWALLCLPKIWLYKQHINNKNVWKKKTLSQKQKQSVKKKAKTSKIKLCYAIKSHWIIHLYTTLSQQQKQSVKKKKEKRAKTLYTEKSHVSNNANGYNIKISTNSNGTWEFSSPPGKTWTFWNRHKHMADEPFIWLKTYMSYIRSKSGLMKKYTSFQILYNNVFSWVKKKASGHINGIQMSREITPVCFPDLCAS
jgi:hypothetical protein